MLETKSLISEVLVSNDYKMMLGMYIVCVYSIYCCGLCLWYICMFTSVVFVFQDEMELMREEHEKELQELKVDNSI